MNKLILSLLLFVPFASGIAAESDPEVRPPEKKYIIALYELSPVIGLIISDIASVRRHNCNDTMTIKRMQDTLANDVFVSDTLRRNAADLSYMDSEAYRAELNRNYRQCH
ncbi:hypothetical protein AN237_25230 (plasmid) [Raoultella ornithinolytica]|nr:hypothetical protein AN237_25230 [Raoultella ornithinolytica]